LRPGSNIQTKNVLSSRLKHTVVCNVLVAQVGRKTTLAGIEPTTFRLF